MNFWRMSAYSYERKKFLRDTVMDLHEGFILRIHQIFSVTIRKILVVLTREGKE